MANKQIFHYEITERVATLSEKGYRSKELNMISYGGGVPKFDLRVWLHVDGAVKMGKGITLDADELRALRDVLNGLDGL